MKNTCVLVFFAAPLSIGSGLLFALLLNSNIRFKPFFQSVYFLPFVTSMVAVSIVWSWMLNKDYGLVNGVIRFFGGKKIAWMTDILRPCPYWWHCAYGKDWGTGLLSFWQPFRELIKGTIALHGWTGQDHEPVLACDHSHAGSQFLYSSP